MNDMNKVGFEMSVGEKVRTEKRMLDKKITKDGLLGLITGFTHDNTTITQDKVILELDAPYYEFKPNDSDKVYRLAIVRGDKYPLRAASENLRNQLFKETAKSSYSTIVNDPTSFLCNTTPVNVRCDKITPSLDGKSLILEGNVQLTDGGTRSLLIWEMQDYEDAVFDKCLKSVCIPINIHTREEYGDKVKLAGNSASRNTSTQVKIFNVAMGAGVFDNILTYFGKYCFMLSKKGVTKNSADFGKKYSAQGFLDDFIGLDPYMFHSTLSPDVKEYGVKNNLTSFSHQAYGYAQNGHLADAQNYLSYMKPIGEDSARLTEFLDYEFLTLVHKTCPQYLGVFVTGSPNDAGEYTPKHSKNFSLTDSTKEKLFTWNYATRRMLIMCMRSLILEGEHGLYFEIDPVELLRNETFIEMMCSFFDSKLTISKEMLGEKKIKQSAVESRNSKNAESIYNKIYEYTRTCKRFMVQG